MLVAMDHLQTFQQLAHGVCRLVWVAGWPKRPSCFQILGHICYFPEITTHRCVYPPLTICHKQMYTMMYVTVNEWRVCVVSSCPVFPHFCAFIRLVGKVERLTVSRSDGSTLAAVPPIRRRGKRKPSWWSGITRESVAKRSVHSEKSRQDTMSPHSTILYRPLHLSTFHVGHA